jgi:hypothetical protein
MFVSIHCFDPLTSNEYELWGEDALAAAVAAGVTGAGVGCCPDSAQDTPQVALTGAATNNATVIVVSTSAFIVFIWISPLTNDCIPLFWRRRNVNL